PCRPDSGPWLLLRYAGVASLPVLSWLARHLDHIGHAAIMLLARNRGNGGREMTGHAVVVAGAGPTGMMLAGELALAGIGVAIVERRVSQELVGTRSRGLQSRTIEVLDQRGIADRFLSQGTPAQVAGFSGIRLDISDFPTRHPYGLALLQDRFEEIL